MRTDFLVEAVDRSIREAESLRSKLQKQQLRLPGFSAPKNRHFLNNLLGEVPGARYLEIGVLHGSTFVSALFQNSFEQAVALDNWSEFEGSTAKFSENLQNNLSADQLGKVSLVEGDSFSVPVPSGPFDIYFYDGNHADWAQRQAVTRFLPSLSQEFVFIVDDWNWDFVQRGTREGIEESGLKTAKMWELPARMNGDTEQWWNGMMVGVFSK